MNSLTALEPITFEDFRSMTRPQIVKEFNPLSVSQKLEWHNKGDLDFHLEQVAYTFNKRILDWIESQIKDFLIENKISVKNWKKHGVIQSLALEIGGQSYILYYKTWRKELKRKITVEYNSFIK